MATVEWQQKKETFNPDKNYFEITYETVSRETSEEEDRLERNSGRCFNWGASLTVFGILIGLIGGAVFGGLEIWPAFITVVALCGASILVGTVGLMNKGQKYDEMLERYVKEHAVWDTPEVQEILNYNKEQNDLAVKWRAEHPLEEKIRACLLDPKSSVDVANLARYYAEVYLKEKNDEAVG